MLRRKGDRRSCRLLSLGAWQMHSSACMCRALKVSRDGQSMGASLTGAEQSLYMSLK